MNRIFAAFLVHLGLWSAVALALHSLPAHAQAASPNEASAPIYLPYLMSSVSATATPQPGVTPTVTATPSPTPTATPTASAVAGFFTPIERWSYGGDIAVDSAGGVHVVYFVPAETPDGVAPAYYSYCANLASCGSPMEWPRVRIGVESEELQLQLTTTGRPRILLRRGANHNLYSSFFYYLACDSNCLDSAGWQDVLIAGTSTSDVTRSSRSHHYFALDPEDRPRVVYNDSHAGRERIGTYYTFCDNECSDHTNWNELELTMALLGEEISLNNPALAISTTGNPHFLASLYTDQLIEGYDGPVLVYLACSESCESTVAGWSFTPLAPVGFGTDQHWMLALDAQNRPRAAFYPATISGGGGDQLYYLWCNSACQQDGWTPVSLGFPSGVGRGAYLRIDGENRPRMVFRAPAGLGYGWCTQDCEGDGAQWQVALLEAADAIAQDTSIPILPDCNLSGWSSGMVPAWATDGAGNLHVIFQAQQLQNCEGGVKTTYHGVRLLVAPHP